VHTAVFLDRDGVINRPLLRDGLPYPPSSVAEVEILPGVAETLAALKTCGFRLIVVTNQPDVARGVLPQQAADDIHRHLQAQLPLDAILSCFHDDEASCECRKPKPGLLLQAARDFDIDLNRSFMVGDRWRDIEAGRRAGCRTFFVDRTYAERQPHDYDYRVDSLAGAGAIIMAAQ
jgi:D-glycero-D-manno-heptose 1,7-bisphosphate phosphatase